MYLVQVYQVMQRQEYGDILVTEAVAGFTATGLNTCLEHCLLNHQVFSTSELCAIYTGSKVMMNIALFKMVQKL